jgi:alpha-N-acetylglucosamine transferase
VYWHTLASERSNIQYFLKPVNPIIMKRRVRKIANFFAFNLLFFALYLNFIHKDKSVISATPATQQTSAAFSGTVLVENPEASAKKEISTSVEAAQPAANTTDNGTALKLSIN